LPTANRATTEYHNVCSVGPIIADIRGVTADSTQGINQLLDRQIQVACSELPLQDAEKIAAKENQQIEANPVGLVVFALIVNQNVGIQNLTLQNIEDIYTGRITNWREVGGNKGNISLLSRNPGSGTRRAFERFVFRGQYGTMTSVSSTGNMYNAVTS